MPLDICYPSLTEVICNQPAEGLGEIFTTFTIPKKCPTCILHNKSAEL